MLLDEAEEPGPKLAAAPAAELRHVRPQHADGARRRELERGEDAKERGLAGAARAEHDEDFALGDAQREALQRSGLAFRSRIHAKDVAGLDRRHRATVRVVSMMIAAATAA